MIENNIFTRTNEDVSAFEALKKVTVMLPMLALPSYSIAFIVEINPSKMAIGVVLSQNQRPIVYFSHMFFFL